MRTIRVLTVVALACGLAGCAGQADPPVVYAAGPAPALQTVELAQRNALPLATGPESSDTAVRPLGPADPRYEELPLGVVPPALAVTTVGPYRMRNWPTQTVRFSDGRIAHMPRWFADPYDDRTMYPQDCYGWSREDAIGFVYCPGRFLANLIALPVTVVVHPLWAPAYTDRTATIVETEQGVEVRPAASPPPR